MTGRWPQLVRLITMQCTDRNEKPITYLRKNYHYASSLAHTVLVFQVICGTLDARGSVA